MKTNIKIQHGWRALALALALAGAHGMALSQVSKAVAERLMHKSGLWEQLGAIGPQMEAGLGSVVDQMGEKEKLSPDELKRLSQAFASAYSPLHLRSSVAGALSARIPPADVAKLEAWYDSPDGQATSQVEEAAATASDAIDLHARVQAGAKVLEGASAERQALLAQLAEVTRASEATVNIMLNSAMGIQEGVVNAQPALAKKSSVKEMRAAIEQQRPAMKKRFDSIMPALFASTYAGLSDEALAHYVDFLKSPSGRAYTDLSLRALDRAFTESGQAMGRSIPALKSNASL